jgi:hypothetical protein
MINKAFVVFYRNEQDRQEATLENSELEVFNVLLDHPVDGIYLIKANGQTIQHIPSFENGKLILKAVPECNVEPEKDLSTKELINILTNRIGVKMTLSGDRMLFEIDTKAI